MRNDINVTSTGLLRSAEEPGALSRGRSPMTLTEQERATLRAALHCWQNELSYFMTEELQDYYPDLRGDPKVTSPGGYRGRSNPQSTVVRS